MISMKLGWSRFALAALSALLIASMSFPSSIKNVSKPCASKRARTFSVNAISVFPSIVILFESYKTISLPNFKVPASAAAS